MIDLKKTKKQIKKEREGWNQPLSSDSAEEYPYGTTLRFEKYMIDKIDALKKANAGDMVRISAIGKVVEVRTTDSAKDRSHHSVEVQVQKIDIKGKSKDAPEDEDDSFNG